MNWFIFAIISVLSISIANIFQRIVMKEPDSDPLGSAIFFQFMLTFLTGIFALFKGFVSPPLIEFPLNFIISSVFYALGTLTLFNAAKRIEASEITILSAFGAIVTILGAIVFLHETIATKQIIGTLLIISSVLLVQNKIHISRNKGLLYAILGTSFYALAVVSDTYILKKYDAVSYTPVISFLPGVILLAMNPTVVTRFKNFVTKRYLRNMTIYGLFYSIQAITYFIVLNMGVQVSQMTVIAKFQIILTVLLAAILLKERSRLSLKLFSAIIATLGVLLMK